MNDQKTVRAVICVSFLLLCCFFTGCSASFCGFQTGDQEELVFTCKEDLPEQPEASLKISEGTESPDQSPDEHGEAALEESRDEKVDLNTADLEELMTLNGVGETRAKAIMEYRTRNGSFRRIEDIMQIPGIKEGIFSKIKDQITVR